MEYLKNENHEISYKLELSLIDNKCKVKKRDENRSMAYFVFFVLLGCIFQVTIQKGFTESK